jgi:uncharacterized protein (TIGR02145 family)
MCLTTSCSEQNDDPDVDPPLPPPIDQPSGGKDAGLYVGIVGFNDNLTTKNISLLKNETQSQFNSFVDGLQTKSGTVLYYSVDKAIDMLREAELPNDLVNVSIITFTDGLDQGSLAFNAGYETKAAYRDALHNRIVNTKIANVNLSAYSIGMKGTDVSNNDEFQGNLTGLASSSSNRFEVKDMEEVNVRFRDIAASLYTETNHFTVKVKIPIQENGAKIRITLDNITDPTKTNLSIEGTFDLATKSLKNIIYLGLSSGSGTSVTGVTEGVFVTFSFTNVINESKEVIPMDYVKLWVYESSRWQINSEFSKEGNTETVSEQKSAMIMLVMDCSSSLGSDFGNIKTAAKNFIDVLLEGSASSNLGSSVLINGIRWATSNVDVPGFFATRPEDAGKFYQWNRPVGWATTGEVANWNSAQVAGSSWADANDPCPPGWRVPKESELQKLLAATNSWTTRNGVYGRIFGNAPNQIFLPASGQRSGSTGTLELSGSFGYYWSSTPYDVLSRVYCLRFNFLNVDILYNNFFRTNGYSVRCVAKD